MVYTATQQMQAPSKRRKIILSLKWRLSQRDVVRRRNRTRQLRTFLAEAIALIQPGQRSVCLR